MGGYPGVDSWNLSAPAHRHLEAASLGVAQEALASEASTSAEAAPHAADPYPLALQEVEVPCRHQLPVERLEWFGQEVE